MTREQARAELASALALILRTRGCATDRADAIALELIASAEGRGWRPIEAVTADPITDLRQAARAAVPPDSDTPGATAYQAARNDTTGDSR